MMTDLCTSRLAHHEAEHNTVHQKVHQMQKLAALNNLQAGCIRGRLG